MHIRVGSISITVLLLIALSISTVPGKAQTQQPTSADPLLAILALVPDTPDIRGGAQIATYANYRAAAAGVTLPDSATALTGEQRSAYFHAMARFRTGPQALAYLTRLMGKMPTTVGFDWFDVDSGLEFGTPPHLGLIFAGKFDPEKIGKALAARNFAETQVEGVSVWSRFDDLSMHVEAVDPGDPFGGTLGMAARVAVWPDMVANTRTTDGTAAIIRAYKHIDKSLAYAADFQALAGAISDPTVYTGSLIQAAIFTPKAFAAPAGTPKGMPNPPKLSEYGPLPPYLLAALADRQEGADQVVLAAVVYPDADTAQQVSAELQKRIAGFDPANVFTKVGAKVEEPRIFKADGGPRVVVISIRYPLPPTAPTSGTAMQAGLIFAQWMNAVNQRQFYPLDTDIPAK